MVIFYVQASTLNLLEMLRFGICYPDNKNLKYVKEKRRETLAEKLQPLTVLAFYSIIVVKSHLKRQADQHLSSSLAITCMWFTACILTFPKQKMKHYLLRILKLLNKNMPKSLKLIAQCITKKHKTGKH